MAIGRLALSASVLVLSLASPAVSEEIIVSSPPAYPVEVVITPDDAVPAGPSSPPTVVDAAPAADALEFAVAVPDGPWPPIALDPRAFEVEQPVVVAQPEAQTPSDLTTAALPRGAAEPPTPAALSEIVDQPMPPIDIWAALPPPPETPPLVLDGLTPQELGSARSTAIAQAVAAEIGEAVRQAWLPAAEQHAVLAFYAARENRPLWHGETGPSAAARAVQAQLGRAAEDGLRAADYAVELAPAQERSATSMARADLSLSLAAIRYARDARGGRIDPRRLSSLITPTLSLPGATEVLTRLSDTAVPGAVLASYQPSHEGYRALRDKLAQLGAASPTPIEPAVRIPAGPAIRIGMRDARIQLLRARFGLGPDTAQIYDRSLATVVAEFQRENGLPANGVLTRATQAALNGETRSGLQGDLIAAMERWRWLPADLGPEHVIVNVPEYMVRKVEDGRVVHEARVVVGKAERPTPIFSDLMDHLVVNPSWTVPPTILRKDFLPKLATDPGYAERRGLEVIRRGNQITLRQPPGPSNALGNIKFMFPNDHAVYLHDTPSRNLFGTSRRAYSSGCVRVERPMKLAELVLGGPEQGWTERRLQGMVGSGERTIRLARKLPIHLVYMTHVVDGDGVLRTHEDIYGFHRRTREALGL